MRLRRISWRIWLSLTAAMAGGCQTSTQESQDARPKLVVSIVLDQVGSWVLDQYIGQLDPHGAIRQAIARGAFHHKVVYDYAGTSTAPGHASIYTGVSPYKHGVGANDTWDAARTARLPTIDDGVHQVLGSSHAFASPAVLEVDTVADMLRAKSPRSQVISVSMKDRGAVIPGGKRPTAVYWYDAETKGFTTSTYYRSTLPEWLMVWHRRHPISRYMSDWSPIDASRMEMLLGKDKGVGEEDVSGFGLTFPHSVRRATSPYDVFPMTPASTEWLLDFAFECAVRHRLGLDASPDLLAVSVSSTDKVGHAFGPNSWEALDNLIRIDIALGKFIERLERRGPVAVLMTADHGVVPLAEYSKAIGRTAFRIDTSKLRANVEKVLDSAFGERDWVSGFAVRLLYLSPFARSKEMRPKVMPLVLSTLAGAQGMHTVVDIEEARGWTEDVDPIRRAIARTLPKKLSADVYVVPQPYSILTARQFGTAHSTPWWYDTQVPVIFMGPGVAHMETRKTLEQSRVAPTLSALLGVETPSSSDALPLPGLSP